MTHTSLGENGAGEGQVGHQLTEFFDLGFLVRDGRSELGDGSPELFLGLRDLLGFVADRFGELLLQIGMPLLESHSVDARLGSEGGKSRVGGGGHCPLVADARVVLRRGLPAVGAARTPLQGFTLRTVVSFYRESGLIGCQIHPGSGQNCPAEHRSFERFSANGDLPKRDRLRASRGVHAMGHL
ncbi:hypothetical protein ACFW1M_34870 [Streptomyces inhibens]|uniref:hypothetical protein n=1 Tax=Streptomyces inhibens TaxID=2293571 RepID=UPI0036B17505